MLSKSEVKYIQSLYHKKFRDEHGCFVMEGEKMINEILSMKKDNVKILYALKDWVTDNKNLLVSSDRQLHIVEPHEMEKISFHKTASPVLAVVHKPEMMPFSEVNGPVIMLDTIQDPGNLGTIIRTADWFGITNILCSNGTADCYNPKVIQSTMGSIFRVNIHYVDLMQVIEENKNIPVWVTSLDGKDISALHPPEKFFLVIGNESKGVQQTIQLKATQKILIPGTGAAESLNAAVAAGIMMYWLKSF